MKHLIDIEYPFTYLNDYINAERTNRFKAAKIKRDTTRYISLIMRGKKIETPCKLKFIWNTPTRGRDLDNMSFAQKYILDGMTKAGVITNDNCKHIHELTHTYQINKTEGVQIFYENKEE